VGPVAGQPERPHRDREFWQWKDDWITFGLMRNGNRDPALVSLMY